MAVDFRVKNSPPWSISYRQFANNHYKLYHYGRVHSKCFTYANLASAVINVRYYTVKRTLCELFQCFTLLMWIPWIHFLLVITIRPKLSTESKLYMQITAVWFCNDVYLFKTDVLVLKSSPQKLTWNDCSERNVSISQWQVRSGPHISRKNKSKYFIFIVMWARHASRVLLKPPIRNSTGLISVRPGQNEKEQEKTVTRFQNIRN